MREKTEVKGRSVNGIKIAKRSDPGQLTIHTFGGLSLYYDGKPFHVVWESQKARLLFCYLVIASEQWVHRDKIIENLWPGGNGNTGASNFKTTLSRLRKSFSGCTPINPVMMQGDAFRINVHAIAIDASRFRQSAVAGIKLVARGENQSARGYLEAAQDLYAGEFLPEEPFVDFINNARRELAELHASVLTCLGKIYQREGNQEALDAFLFLNKGALNYPA